MTLLDKNFSAEVQMLYFNYVLSVLPDREFLDSG